MSRSKDQGRSEEEALPSIGDILRSATLNLDRSEIGPKKGFLVVPHEKGEDPRSGEDGNGDYRLGCPCGHCGSERGRVRREQMGSERERSSASIDGASTWFYECDFCGARGPLASDARDARHLWNQRRRLSKEEGRRRTKEKKPFEQQRENLESKTKRWDPERSL